MDIKTIVIFFILMPLALMAKQVESNWQAKLNKSKGKTIKIAAWGGSKEINNWLDQTVAKELKSKYEITLKRVALDDTATAISQLLSDKKIKRKTGRFDILWVNGENYKLMAENDLTIGAFSNELPNVENFVNLDQYKYDFGIAVNHQEVPWGNAIFVMAHDKSKIKTFPKNLDQLKELLKQNPGKFTYPKPPDYTGSAFLRLLMLNLDNNLYQKALRGEEEAFAELMKKLWVYLNELRPYLWEKGANYPESIAKLHQLYSNGEILFSMGYSPTFAEPFLSRNQFPLETKTFIFESGTIGNTHFLTIPFNSTNIDGAQVVINEFLTAKLQQSKLNPKIWGDISVLDMSKLPLADQEAFEKIDLGRSTLPVKMLIDKTITELPAKFVPILEKEWLINAFKN